MIGNVRYSRWIDLWTMRWRTFSWKQARIMWYIVSATTWITIIINAPIESMSMSKFFRWTLTWRRIIHWNNGRCSGWIMKWCWLLMTNQHRKYCRIMIATNDTFIGSNANIVVVIMARDKFNKWKCWTWHRTAAWSHCWAAGTDAAGSAADWTKLRNYCFLEKKEIKTKGKLFIE